MKKEQLDIVFQVYVKSLGKKRASKFKENFESKAGFSSEEKRERMKIW